MELLADKELIDNVKKLVNNNQSTENVETNVQSGGFVFNLIFYMTKIFDSDPATLRKMAQNLHNMREVFKNGVTDLINDLHEEDLDDIDTAFIRTLRDHYIFWEDKIMEFIKNAQKVKF